MKNVPLQLLQSLERKREQNNARVPAPAAPSVFDIETWISGHGVDVEGPSDWQGGRRWVLRGCPWNPEHRNNSAYIVQLPSGAIAAGCHHNGCAGKDWHSLRDLVEPVWRNNGHRGVPPTIKPEIGEWETPIPFHHFDVPSFPTDALPGWLKDFVCALANATQTPVDLAGMLSLALVAAACAKKVVVRLKKDHVEPVNIFTVVALPPGNRKSAVFRAVSQPLEEFEKTEAQRAVQTIARQQSLFKIKEAKLKKLQQQAADAKTGELESLITAASELAAEIAQMPTRNPPRYIVDDCTPERLATILSEQDGRLALMSPEGDVFDLMAGRYSVGAGNLGVYLKGHAGDQLRVDRVGRAPEFVNSPALTVGLAVQPEVIRGLIEKPGFRGRGLLGRFLYSLPNSMLGHRDIDPPTVPDEVRLAYHNRMLDLFKLQFARDSAGEPSPHPLHLDHDAQECMRDFERWLEPQLAEFGELGTLSDWAGKLVGAVGRIAGILHMAAFAGDEAPWETPIPGQTVEYAIKIGKYCILHARASYAEMGADAVQDAAKHILRWIEYRHLDRFTKREVHQGLKGTFKRAEDVDAPLALLEKHWFIRKEPEAEREGAGRRRSPTYEVNPHWAFQNAQTSKSSEEF